MPSLDADLVRRWLLRVDTPDLPVTDHPVTDHPDLPHWTVVPTDQEAAALRIGARRLESALDPSTDGGELLDNGGFGDGGGGATNARFTEPAARMLHRYLDAFAAGVGSTRLAFAGNGTVAGDDGDGVDEPDVGSLALAAGLNAGAAALHSDVAAAARRPIQYWESAEPTAAESARLAGFAAAELVVDGAGLHGIAAAAAAAVTNGWRSGPPEDAPELIEHRIRGLVGTLLMALEVETRDPEPPTEPAPCGAGPGENLGRRFGAEITFTMGLAGPEIAALCDDLVPLAVDVTVWSGGQWPKFHIHTDHPGSVLNQIFSYGTPFDLLITSLD